MAHRALTLKYRPQVFADMVGQDHVSSVLARALQSGRVAHAYLFTGARGVGKTTAARILAKALNCERRVPGKGVDPCNECTSCTEITNGVSLDVAEIDGASNRGIADVQALREKVRFSPTGGRHRVVIIDEVHQLSNDAFAALLKTLEEPPAHLVFIFATTDPQKLPETIRSRTQRFDFARVPLRKVADRLRDIMQREAKDPEGVKFTLTEGAAFLIAHKSEGSMRDAVSALDQVISAGEPAVDEELVRRVLGIADREAFFAVADGIVRRDPKAALRSLHAAFEKGLDARELSEGLSEHLRHLLVLKVDPEGQDLIAAGSDELARLGAQAEGWSENDLLRLLKIVSEVPAVMRDSPQPLIHLEAAVMQMATLEPGELLAGILERLESLERRMNGGPGSAPRAQAPASGAASAPASTPRTTAGTPPARTAPTTAPRAQAPQAGAFTGAREPVPALAAVPVPSPRAAVPDAAPRAAAATLDVPEGAYDEGAALKWREAVGRVNERKRMLGAFLEESRFVGVSESMLLLETDDLHRTVIEEKENRAIVTEALGHVFGGALGLRCVAPSATGVPRPVRTNADFQPMIDQAIAFFEGERIDPAARRSEPRPRPESNFRKEYPRG